MRGFRKLYVVLLPALVACSAATDGSTEDPEAASEEIGSVAQAATFCTNNAQCNDLNACTNDTCNLFTHACVHTNKSNGTACSDGNACTAADKCVAGVCTGNAVVCTAADQCHAPGTCNVATGLCSNPARPNGVVCNDGNACTTSEVCVAGTCTGGSPVVCNAADQCHAPGTCNATTGLCSNPARPNGVVCNDGNACTTSEVCVAGTCTGGSPIVCTAADQCHAPGTCNATTGLCSNPARANGTVCNDANACTSPDVCVAGSCVGTPICP